MIVTRVPSGIPGLDTVLQGGIPTNSSLALRTEASNFAEAFQQQFIAEGLKLGFPALYCCLTRSAASVINSMKHQGFDVSENIANDELVFLDCYSMHKRTSMIGVDKELQKKIITVADIDDEKILQNGLATAVERLHDIKGLRAVCENVAGTLTSRSPVEMMRWGRRAFGDLRAFQTVVLHTFPIGIRMGLFNLMAPDFDGVFDMKIERGTDRVRHYLSIQKMRMTIVPPKMHELDLTNGMVTLKTIQKIT